MTKQRGLIGGYNFSLKGPATEIDINLEVNEKGGILSSLNPSFPSLLDGVGKLNLELLFLHDTRRIETTYGFLQESQNQRVQTRLLTRSALSRTLSTLTEDEITNSSGWDIGSVLGHREPVLPLHRILDTASEWIRRRALLQGSTGDLDASRVYVDVLTALSQPGRSKQELEPLKESLVHSLRALEQRAEDFVRHGFLTKYPFESLVDILNSAAPSRVAEMKNVLSPYIDSISTRLEALGELQSVVSVFESELNSYLRDKAVSVNLLDGIQFSDGRTKLDVDSLSSGERQLVFLFCAALLAGERRSIFMIDEPELSINVKWQRKLVDSLVKIVHGRQTQFIMATHSIEILAKHRGCVCELNPRAYTAQDN